MNSINITGRLTSDPELGALPTGESVCKLRLAVDGLYVTVEAAERLQLPLSFLGAPAVKLRAKAMARLTLGYESPSSFLPFSVSTL